MVAKLQDDIPPPQSSMELCDPWISGPLLVSCAFLFPLLSPHYSPLQTIISLSLPRLEDRERLKRSNGLYGWLSSVTIFMKRPNEIESKICIVHSVPEHCDPPPVALLDIANIAIPIASMLLRHCRVSRYAPSIGPYCTDACL